MEKIFILIEISSTGTGLAMIKKLCEQGYSPWVISNNPGRFDFPDIPQLRLFHVDTNNESRLIEFLLQHERRDEFVAVSTVYDFYVPAAAAVARALALPGPHVDAARRARHKHHQRTVFAHHNLPQPKFAVCSTVDEALSASHQIGYPLVCKPVSGAGSVGVKYITSDSELKVHAGTWLSLTQTHRGVPIQQKVLLEEFVCAPEVSVEVFDGKAVTVCDKFVSPLPLFLEVGHEVPSVLPSGLARSACKLAEGAVQALGLDWGCCHVELHVTRDGLSVIEVNQRIAGDLIPQLVEEAIGVDLLSAAILKATGVTPSLSATCDRVSRIAFLVSGEIPSAMHDTFETIAAESGARDAHLGKDHGKGLYYGDSRDRIGHLIVSGSSRSSVRDNLDKLLAKLSGKERVLASPSQHDQPRYAFACNTN
ncbi:ATP-grasp domain-containing protein [Burkholderia ubonensis]|uniref:ATP-grasp domain-containing protein n=1 Tax=Burkholderia ubonensis TaxID=101571 RepID=UPI0009B4882C|nr:ATP-grasp domain-containing protein [Burkholderia ubonensis]